MIITSAWAQAAANEDQTFWTCDGPIQDMPLKQAVIGVISHVTAHGSRYDWDGLRTLHLLQEDAGLSAVLELPQPVLDLSGRHLLVSIHAGPFWEIDMVSSVQAMRDVLACSDAVDVEASPPSDLLHQMSRLAKKENSMRIRLRRKMASTR